MDLKVKVLGKETLEFTVPISDPNNNRCKTVMDSVQETREKYQRRKETTQREILCSKLKVSHQTRALIKVQLTSKISA